MATLADNARSPRRHPLRLLSTLSAGYYLAMVTVLGQQVGCHEAVGFNQARAAKTTADNPSPRPSASGSTPWTPQRGVLSRAS